MDSLQYAPSTLALPISVNLEEMLFGYGVRVNTDLLQDARCASIPWTIGLCWRPIAVGVAAMGLFSHWSFPQSEHPVVKNLNGIKLEFASSIDTIAVKGIKKPYC
jgi:ABC-2 type transport system permease protein